MDPITMMMLVSGGVAIAGGIIGKLAAQGDHAAAQKARDLALQTYGDAAAPQLDDVVAKTQGSTNLRNEDPRFKGTQIAVMDRLRDTNGTMDAEARAQQAGAEADAARMNRGYQGQLDQQMAARGMGGSGLEYLGQQMGIQNAANSLNQSGIQAAASREKEKTSRLMAAAGLAGNVREQDMNVNRAQDEIDRFNTESLNRNKYYNSGLQTQRFRNDQDLRAGKYGAYKDSANAYEGRAADTEAFATGVGKGAGESIKGAATYGLDAEQKKKG